MKRLFGFVALAALAAASLHAQAVNTTVCDVLKNPAAFDGKMVTIKGTVVAGYDQFVISDGNCAQDVNGIWLDYPTGSKVKSGPISAVQLTPAKNFAGTLAAANRAPVTLLKDKLFKQFDSALTAMHNTTSLCLGCMRYSVTATLTGRLDGVKEPYLTRKGDKIVGLGGFGNMNAYPARLVIASVADVAQKEIDFSATDAAVKALEKAQSSNAPPPGPGAAMQSGALSFSDAITLANKLIANMAENPLTIQLKKDMDGLPKPKELNGVTLETGTANEVPAGEAAPGAVDSPDGVLYTITINRDRLPGNAVMVAVTHASQHVADLRTPPPGNEMAPALILENNSWAVTSTLAIFSGEKTITVSGGTMLWNTLWPADSRVENMQKALADFLSKEEMFNK